MRSIFPHRVTQIRISHCHLVMGQNPETPRYPRLAGIGWFFLQIWQFHVISSVLTSISEYQPYSSGVLRIHRRGHLHLLLQLWGHLPGLDTTLELWFRGVLFRSVQARVSSVPYALSRWDHHQVSMVRSLSYGFTKLINMSLWNAITHVDSTVEYPRRCRI